MPAYNLPSFSSLASPPSSPTLASKPSCSYHRRTHSSPATNPIKHAAESNPMSRKEGGRPVLSIIQPNSQHSTHTHSSSSEGLKLEEKLLPALPLPSPPSSSPSRSNTSPTRRTPRPTPIRSTSFPSSLSNSPTSPSPPQPQARRRPLSRRYTRPPSLTSRSPLQSHSIPSFSISHHTLNASTSLFEELLMRNLERRFGERLELFKAGGEKVQGLGGALKPGRELLIWSAVNRCKEQQSQSQTQSQNENRGKGLEAWRESGLKGRTGTGHHKRSHTLPDLRRKEEEQEEEDDDEPLARQLEQVIKKRQEQYERIQIERVVESKSRRSMEEEAEKEREREVERKRREISNSTVVKIKLPQSPQPAKLKPLPSTSTSTITTSSNPPPPASLPSTESDNRHRMSKRTRTSTRLCPNAQPFLPSSASNFSPRWFPSLPERVATSSCGSSAPAPSFDHLSPASPSMVRSKSDSAFPPLTGLPPTTTTTTQMKGRMEREKEKEGGGGGTKLKKRSRSEGNGLLGFSSDSMGRRRQGNQGVLSF